MCMRSRKASSGMGLVSNVWIGPTKGKVNYNESDFYWTAVYVSFQGCSNILVDILVESS